MLLVSLQLVYAIGLLGSAVGKLFGLLQQPLLQGREWYERLMFNFRQGSCVTLLRPLHGRECL